MENAGLKSRNNKVSSDLIKGKKNLRDMIKSLDQALPPPKMSRSIDDARSSIVLPGIFFSGWTYHVIGVTLLDSSWTSLFDIGSFKIPTKIENLHSVVDCCRVMLKVKVCI